MCKMRPGIGLHSNVPGLTSKEEGPCIFSGKERKEIKRHEEKEAELVMTFHVLHELR